MRLRPLEERDLEVVRQLRNANRQAFFDDRSISIEEQRQWFTTLNTQHLRFYVIEQDHQVVGTISVRSSDDATHEIGNIIIDQTHRGEGLMRGAIEELTRAPGVYTCRVRPDNESSLAVFRRCGFVAEYVQLRKPTLTT